MAHVDLLRRIPFLSALGDEDLTSLASRCESLTFHAGEDVFEQGKPNDSLFIVASGTLHAARSQNGRRVLLGRLEAGNFFGELSAFDPGPTTGGVRALTDATVVRLRRTELEEFAAGRPTAGSAVYRGLLEQVAHRLREADERLADAVTWGKLQPAG